MAKSTQKKQEIPADVVVAPEAPPPEPEPEVAQEAVGIGDIVGVFRRVDDPVCPALVLSVKEAEAGVPIITAMIFSKVFGTHGFEIKDCKPAGETPQAYEYTKTCAELEQLRGKRQERKYAKF